MKRISTARGIFVLAWCLWCGNITLNAQGPLEGTVLDSSSGRPLPGVTVKIKGTAEQDTTDAQGKFTLGSAAIYDCRLTAASQAWAGLHPGTRTFRWKAGFPADLSLYDVNGRAIMACGLSEQQNLDWRHLSDGMYLLSIRADQAEIMGRVMLAGTQGNASITAVGHSPANKTAAKAAADVTLVLERTDFYLTREVTAATGSTGLQFKLYGYPNEVNTGPTGTLTSYTGAASFYDDNAVIENKEIAANGLYIAGSNITFRNCKFTYTGAMDASFTMVNICGGCGAAGITFEDCEFDGADKCSRAVSGGGAGTSDQGVVVRRCNIHNTGNAVEVGQRFTVEDSYLHDIFTPSGQGWHADGIQAANGTISDMTIQHNTILLTGPETGCINICTDNITNCIVDNNLMGGGGYSMYTFGDNLTNYRVTNNRFTTRIYPKVGYWNLWYPNALAPATGPVVSGNTIWETGAAANSNL